MCLCRFLTCLCICVFGLSLSFSLLGFVTHTGNPAWCEQCVYSNSQRAHTRARTTGRCMHAHNTHTCKHSHTMELHALVWAYTHTYIFALYAGYRTRSGGSVSACSCMCHCACVNGWADEVFTIPEKFIKHADTHTNTIDQS